MTDAVPTVLTVGYEGADQAEVVRRLTEARVTQLLDVRWRPQSRKRGFSKTPLAAALADVGIAYRHERALGTPPEMLAAAHAGDGYDWDAYEAFLLTQSEGLDAGRAFAEQGRTALLCFEASPYECHRRVVARHVAADLGFGVVHL